jgi:chromosome segregation ATPase
LKTDIINNQQAHQDNQAALVACTTENEKRLAQLQNINEQLQEDLNQQQTQILRDTESRFVQLQTRISKLDQQFQGKLNTTNRALQQKFRWQIVVGVLSATAIVGGIIGAIVGSYVSVCWLLPSPNAPICNHSE